jgi:hypothetical protein
MISQNNMTENQSFPIIDLSKYTQKGQSQDITGLYESFSRLGYQYGKDWQAIKNIWKHEDKWLLELNVPIFEKGQTTQLDPALLDGLFQSVLAIEYFFAGQPPKDNTLHVPYIIKSFNMSSELTEHCFVYLEKQDIQKKGGDIYAQLRAYNAAGQGILEIQGMIFKQVSNQFSLKESKQVYFYQPTWVKQTLSSQKRDFENRHAILFDIPKATQLRQKITQSYQEYLIIKPSEDYIKIVQERLTQVNKECDIYYL